MLARARSVLRQIETNPSLRPSPSRPAASASLSTSESAAAVLCAVATGRSLSKRRRTNVRVKVAEIETRPPDIQNVAIESDNSGEVLQRPDHMKVGQEVIGACLIGVLALPAWHVLPVFLDLKIAADPALPGLTAETLPISSTAIFAGWLLSATMLDRALEVFDQKHLLVLHVLAMLVVAVAMITLPHLTAGNLVIFTGIRFVYGLLMNITALQCVFIQQRLPPGRGNQVLVILSVIYSLVVIFMAWSCGGPTLMLDWRAEALFWYSAPLVLGLAVGFPDVWEIVQSLPVTLAEKLRGKQESRTQVEVGGSNKERMTSQDQRNMIALAIAFLACGCGFYGLTYSAGQLDSSPYMSCMLLHAGDVFGYLLALSADKYGRNTVQAFSFFTAAICLLLCSNGEPGTPLLLSAATVGRLCLDVCFTTIYLALASMFSGASSKMALTICETTARLGGILAPLSGTWPSSVSCLLFSSLCLAAACSTLTMPEEEPRVSDKDERGTVSIEAI